MLARTAQAQEIVFDFFVDTPGQSLPDEQLEPHFLPITVHFPASEQIFNIGMGSVAVPGALAGFLHVHERLGRIGLDRVVAPATRMAREGVVLNEAQAYALALLTPINTLTHEARALFAPDDRTPRPGDTHTNLVTGEVRDDDGSVTGEATETVTWTVGGGG